MARSKRRHSSEIDQVQMLDPGQASVEALDAVDVLDYVATMAEEMAVLVKRIGQIAAGDHLLFASATLRIALRDELGRRAQENFVVGPSRSQ